MVLRMTFGDPEVGTGYSVCLDGAAIRRLNLVIIDANGLERLELAVDLKGRGKDQDIIIGLSPINEAVILGGARSFIGVVAIAVIIAVVAWLKTGGVQIIMAGAAVQRVIPLAAVERIIAGAAGQ